MFLSWVVYICGISKRGEGLNPINWFNPVTFLFLSQAMIWIYIDT